MKIKTVNKWDVIKLKSFCTTKEIINKMSKEPREWEKICAKEVIYKGLISKYANSSYSSISKIQPNEKTGRRSK